MSLTDRLRDRAISGDFGTAGALLATGDTVAGDIEPEHRAKLRETVAEQGTVGERLVIETTTRSADVGDTARETAPDMPPMFPEIPGSKGLWKLKVILGLVVASILAIAFGQLFNINLG